MVCGAVAQRKAKPPPDVLNVSDTEMSDAPSNAVTGFY